MTAPLQVIALSFSRDAGSEDRILAEVDRLRGRGVLRLLDMVFVAKSQDGSIERLIIGEDEDFGSLLAAVVPVTGGSPAVAASTDGSAAFGRADEYGRPASRSSQLEQVLRAVLPYVVIEHAAAADGCMGGRYPLHDPRGIVEIHLSTLLSILKSYRSHQPARASCRNERSAQRSRARAYPEIPLDRPILVLTTPADMP